MERSPRTKMRRSGWPAGWLRMMAWSRGTSSSICTSVSCRKTRPSGLTEMVSGSVSWFSGAAGYVDWFEVGVNGNVTRYNLTPEPATLSLLGLAALMMRRRRA